ncbi:MAG: lytic transglycosylase domain-containing protein [Tissierellia bacterium]|nr:lytic transglycosylase domain-containing protein [Tissierellia bacterium]
MKVIKRFFLLLFVVIFIVLLAGLATVYYGTATRIVKYVDDVEEYSSEYDVDPLLILSVIKVESNFKNDAVSHMNAHGLMQIIPETGEWVANQLNLEYSDEMLQDEETNIKMGTYYLSYLLKHFGNRDLALAAYNGGIGNVSKWLLDEKYSSDGMNLDHIPIDETRNYVVKVNNNYKIYKIFYEGVRLRENMHKEFKTYVNNVFRTVKDIKNKY